MITFTIDIEIARPPAEVFAYVTDPSKLASWQTNTVSAVSEDGGPLRLGSRLREVHRAPGGRELASLVEVSEYVHGRVLALTMIEGALPLDARITFDPAPAGTMLRFTATGRLTGAMRLAAPLLQRTLRRQFAGYCALLRQHLEGAAGPVWTAAG